LNPVNPTSLSQLGLRDVHTLLGEERAIGHNTNVNGIITKSKAPLVLSERFRLQALVCPRIEENGQIRMMGRLSPRPLKKT
jgi:hypothetical protein